MTTIKKIIGAERWDDEKFARLKYVGILFSSHNAALDRIEAELAKRTCGNCAYRDHAHRDPYAIGFATTMCSRMDDSDGCSQFQPQEDER